jgi:hypothetical protein
LYQIYQDCWSGCSRVALTAVRIVDKMWLQVGSNRCTVGT